MNDNITFVRRNLFFLFIFVFSALILVNPTRIRAEGEFVTDSSIEYKVEENGKTLITHNITLENVFSDLYATSYTLVLENINLENPRAFQESTEVALTQSSEGASTILKVDFPNPVVGKGERRLFSIVFEESGLVEKSGQVWEVTIPRLKGNESFRSYSVTLSVPLAFGKEAYIAPTPSLVNQVGDRRVYRFNKSAVESGVTAAFGEFQVFSFSLAYHLENPLAKEALVDIAIPPDTSFQRMYYQLMEPTPENVVVDDDGNWLASYKLKPRERKDIRVVGSVQIFASGVIFPLPSDETLKANLEESEFWQIKDPNIQSLASRLKTPKAIYDYVSTNLTYDYDRVRPNVERFGASRALANPQSAICMEYTDLTVALFRSAGIPAREVNGFAYTENPEIQPLSLVADVLHAWPEYWDDKRLQWTPIDPTWGATTGGLDYFNKLDLRHFTFVIHGKDSVKPYPPGSYKLGPNPQKDVFVNFGQLPEEREGVIELKVEQTTDAPIPSKNFLFTIENTGIAALYDLAPQVLFDGKPTYVSNIKVLPPHSKYTLKAVVPFSFMAINSPESVVLTLGDQRLEVPSFKNQIIIYNLVLIFLLLSLIVLVVFLKIKRIRIFNFRKKTNVTTIDQARPNTPR